MDCRNTAATVSERIGRSAVSALLREVAAAPKPGLVDRRSSGAHDDMDFMTFSDSALALGPVFVELALKGFERSLARPEWVAGCYSIPMEAFTAMKADTAAAATDRARSEDAHFLAALRGIGIEGEARMFKATGGVNTHKGALFVIGALAAAAGALLGAGFQPTADRTRRLAARIVGGVSRREMLSAKTNGAAAFRSYGSLGVRGEVESGLASLDHGALRILRRVGRRTSRAGGAPSAFERAGRGPGDEECVDALLSIMTVADDTTVLHRGGKAALAHVRRSATVALALGGSRSAEGRVFLEGMSADFIRRRISPGGCADLLAAALFLTGIEDEFSGGDSQRTRNKTRPIPAGPHAASSACVRYISSRSAW